MIVLSILCLLVWADVPHLILSALASSSEGLFPVCYHTEELVQPWGLHCHVSRACAGPVCSSPLNWLKAWAGADKPNCSKTPNTLVIEKFEM